MVAIYRPGEALKSKISIIALSFNITVIYTVAILIVSLANALCVRDNNNSYQSVYRIHMAMIYLGSNLYYYANDAE